MARRIPAILLIDIAILCVAVPLMGAERAGAVPDLTGAWARTTFAIEPPLSGQGPLRISQRLGNGPDVYSDPLLKPEAAKIVKQRYESTQAGKPFPTPSSTCWPMVAPLIYRVQEMQLLQTKDHVTLIYMQDHEVRRVRLNGTHPAKVTPSAMGDSVGHYEGDTLVIDTVGIKVGPFTVADRFGTPQSEAMHVVERYRLINAMEARAAADAHEKADGRLGAGRTADPKPGDKGLQLRVTIEDPVYFTTPWSAQITYQRSPQEWQEQVCAENFHEYYGENRDTPIPQATRPDF